MGAQYIAYHLPIGVVKFPKTCRMKAVHFHVPAIATQATCVWGWVAADYLQPAPTGWVQAAFPERQMAKKQAKAEVINYEEVDAGERSKK